jgi:hypothetical protein
MSESFQWKHSAFAFSDSKLCKVLEEQQTRDNPDLVAIARDRYVKTIEIRTSDLIHLWENVRGFPMPISYQFAKYCFGGAYSGGEWRKVRNT